MTQWLPPQSMQRDLRRLVEADAERNVDFQVDDEVHDRTVSVGRERITDLHGLVVGLLDGTSDAATVQAAVASLKADTAAALADMAQAASHFAQDDHPQLEASHASYLQVLEALAHLEDLCQGPPTVSLTAAMQDLETAVATVDEILEPPESASSLC